MNFNALLKLIGKRPWFDLATVVQIADEPREQLQTQLYRWCRAGKLLPLRRGMYAFAEEYRRVSIAPAELANDLYSPSYLSLQWALSYYGLIPEKAVTFTSVTTRQTKRFRNDFGMFTYRHLKPDVFFGAQALRMNGHDVRIAKPEKALLDLWYLEPGNWSRERMAEMRFQNMDILDLKCLAEFALRWASPKLDKAVRAFVQNTAEEMEGTVEL
ncbi:MAG: hypothetical protein R6V56_08005 [Lentisphaeria bacterium]